MRLIDADAVIPKGTKVTNDVIAVHTALATAPTVDAVPVVRCAECVFRRSTGICVKTGFYVNDDEFCSNGEKGYKHEKV